MTNVFRGYYPKEGFATARPCNKEMPMSKMFVHSIHKESQWQELYNTKNMYRWNDMKSACLIQSDIAQHCTNNVWTNLSCLHDDKSIGRYNIL